MTTRSPLRDALRAELTARMRARDRDGVAAVRTALGLLENAEAVPTSDAGFLAGGRHVAGAALGVGASEAGRRTLSDADEHGLVAAEVAELRERGDAVAQGRADLLAAVLAATA